jgi:hypothetical protein
MLPLLALFVLKTLFWYNIFILFAELQSRRDGILVEMVFLSKFHLSKLICIICFAYIYKMVILATNITFIL